MRKQKGFTLIELLVVIAIIALLLSIIGPSLRMAKRKASMIVCLTDVKNIDLAFFMNKEDNDSKLPCSDPADTQGWVRHPMDSGGAILSATSTTPPVTDDDERRGIEAGVLAKYLKSVDVFHCPFDQRKSLWDLSNVLRTYSMPQCLNYTGSRIADPVHELKTYHEIGNPGTKVMLIEEADERNYNFGSWSFGAPEWTTGSLMWWDPLAVTHGDSSTLGFSDGHAENHKWVDSFTKERPGKLSRAGAPPMPNMYGTDAPPANQKTDIEYMYRAWPFKKK